VGVGDVSFVDTHNLNVREQGCCWVK